MKIKNSQLGSEGWMLNEKVLITAQAYFTSFVLKKKSGIAVGHLVFVFHFLKKNFFLQH